MLLQLHQLVLHLLSHMSYYVHRLLGFFKVDLPSPEDTQLLFNSFAIQGSPQDRVSSAAMKGKPGFAEIVLIGKSGRPGCWAS